MVQLHFHVCGIHPFTSFPTTLTPGQVCTLLASRGQRFIWRVCTGAEERRTEWDFQHSRHAAVICISELNMQWICPFYGPSYASLRRFLYCAKIVGHAEAKLGCLQEKQTRLVRQFHFHGWPEIGIPSDGKGMIDIIAAVQKQQQQSGNNPIVVHCRYTHSLSLPHIQCPTYTHIHTHTITPALLHHF